MTGIPVKLPVFEGPLDLLLHLIDTNKIDIYDIPIVEITGQYMEYIRSMETRDLNVMSEFLVMAATLLEIKAKMLLPAEVDEEGEEIDPRAQLVEQLLEYKKYKYMAEELRERQQMAGGTLCREPDIPREVSAYMEPVDLEELLGDLTLQKLHGIFQSLMKRQEDKIDPVRSKFGKIEKEEVSLEDKMCYVERYLTSHRYFSFRSLLQGQKGKMQLIVTFLAVLELIKMGKVTASQAGTFDDIVLEAKEQNPGGDGAQQGEEGKDPQTGESAGEAEDPRTEEPAESVGQQQPAETDGK
ncbi:MAG: segregation/condensation protein A [Lachnospiraceae bacterium]|jgi:segregation and condensation protein A|nr:segregation/condensation protein A [Lachnospiraceae bacterium]MCI9134304.1 segregation/condensation protein A [Lachnospiraceae bacterium]